MSFGDDKVDSGFRVIGRNTSDGALHVWSFPTLDAANHFAEMLCADTGSDATITKFLGRWRRAKPLVEFVSEHGLGSNIPGGTE
jgi:hypothetical protein